MHFLKIILLIDIKTTVKIANKVKGTQIINLLI